jgi:hypothetical protein
MSIKIATVFWSFQNFISKVLLYTFSWLRSLTLVTHPFLKVESRHSDFLKKDLLGLWNKLKGEKKMMSFEREISLSLIQSPCIH